MKKNIYFLGFSKRKTRLINFLKRKKNIKLIQLFNKKLSLKNASKADLIISFGYKKIIKKKILNKLKKPIINLHISFLPFNKGMYPNYWSFVKNTPKGVTIHEINEKIDGGNIIARKKIKFKNFKKLTFKNTYDFLINEIEKLFIKNFKKILNGKYKTIHTKDKGSFQSKKELPNGFKNWDTNIHKYIKTLKSNRIDS